MVRAVVKDEWIWYYDSYGELLSITWKEDFIKRYTTSVSRYTRKEIEQFLNDNKEFYI